MAGIGIPEFLVLGDFNLTYLEAGLMPLSIMDIMMAMGLIWVIQGPTRDDSHTPDQIFFSISSGVGDMSIVPILWSHHSLSRYRHCSISNNSPPQRTTGPNGFQRDVEEAPAESPNQNSDLHLG